MRIKNPKRSGTTTIERKKNRALTFHSAVVAHYPDANARSDGDVCARRNVSMVSVKDLGHCGGVDVGGKRGGQISPNKFFQCPKHLCVLPRLLRSRRDVAVRFALLVKVDRSEAADAD